MYVGLHVYPPHDLGQMSLKLCYLYSSHFSEVVLRMFLYTLNSVSVYLDFFGFFLCLHVFLNARLCSTVKWRQPISFIRQPADKHRSILMTPSQHVSLFREEVLPQFDRTQDIDEAYLIHSQQVQKSISRENVKHFLIRLRCH